MPDAPSPPTLPGHKALSACTPTPPTQPSCRCLPTEQLCPYTPAPSPSPPAPPAAAIRSDRPASPGGPGDILSRHEKAVLSKIVHGERHMKTHFTEGHPEKAHAAEVSE